MNLDPALSRIDRVGSLVIGIGLVGYAALGGIDEGWLRAGAVALGLALAIGGIGGT